jgi:hypothetical protein
MTTHFSIPRPRRNEASDVVTLSEREESSKLTTATTRNHGFGSALQKCGYGVLARQPACCCCCCWMPDERLMSSSPSTAMRQYAFSEDFKTNPNLSCIANRCFLSGSTPSQGAYSSSAARAQSARDRLASTNKWRSAM